MRRVRGVRVVFSVILERRRAPEGRYQVAAYAAVAARGSQDPGLTPPPARGRRLDSPTHPHPRLLQALSAGEILPRLRRFIRKEPFAKFASRWDLLPGRVVIPGSAGVPPAQDLAGSWRLASQGWSVHLPTGAGAAPLQECGRDARAPRGKPMAGQVQIRILQKARKTYRRRFLG